MHDPGNDVSHEVLRILQDYLQRLEQGHPPDPEGLLAEHSDLAEQLSPYLVTLEDLHCAAEDLGGPRAVGTPEDEAAAGGIPEEARLGDFHILREIGRGGMGIVYEAEQISLGRRVAVKVLPFAAVLDKKRLQRFRNESQAAARLHHTNIVPVYGVGYDRGVHYYAMQLIDGSTMAAVMGELRRMREGGAAGSDFVRQMSSSRAANGAAFFRAVAELGDQAAQALEHAHELGVIHRDVKPSNLLLDERARLWITDFGLAAFEGDHDLTLSGDLVGTIRYMSPEQSVGGGAPVDHRTDIYSLGISLYELLTLEPAFRGDNPQELLREIATEDPPPPRRVDPRVPVELETIVLKATAKDPADRYPAARSFGEDLRRFLEDKPIRARRPSLAMRVRKWSLRHRGLVAAAACFLLLAVVGLAIATAVIWQEKERTAGALARARTYYAKAREAVERMLLRVGDSKLEGIPQMSKVRRELLEDGVQIYEGFLAEQPADPQLKEDVARALYSLARLRALLGQLPEAVQALERSVALFADLADEYPRERKHRRNLADARTKLAKQLVDVRRIEDAESVYELALDSLSQLVVDSPNDPGLAYDLAVVHSDIGVLRYGQEGQSGEAEAAFGRAIAILKDLPDLTSARKSLALAYSNLSALLDSRPEDAKAAGEHALAVQTKLAEEFPDDAGIQHGLARILINLAPFLTEAEKVTERAREILAELAGRFPRVPEYQRDLAAAWSNLALLYRSDRPAKAEEAYHGVIATREKLASDHRGVPAYRAELAEAHEDLARFLWNAGNPVGAEESYLAAVQVLRALVEDEPAPDLQPLARVVHNFGKMLFDLGRNRDALSRFEEAIDLYERHIKAHAGAVRARRQAAHNYAHLMVLAESPDEHRAALCGRMMHLQELLGVVADQRQHRDAYHQACVDLAFILADCRYPDLRDPHRALKLANTAVTIDSNRPRGWKMLALACYRTGDWPGAVQAVETTIEVQKGDFDILDCLLRAMAEYHRGDEEQARLWYDRATKPPGGGVPGELAGIHAEATALLDPGRGQEG